MEKVIKVFIFLITCSISYGQTPVGDSIEITDFAFVNENKEFSIRKKYFLPTLNKDAIYNVVDGNQKMIWNIDSICSIKLVSYSRFYRNDTPKDTLIIGNHRFCLEELMNGNNNSISTHHETLSPIQFRILDLYDINLNNSNYILVRATNILGAGHEYTSMVFIFKIDALIEAAYLGEFALIDDLSKVFMDFNYDGNIDFVKWNMVEDANLYSLMFPKIEKLDYKLVINSDLENHRWFWHPRFGDLPQGVKLVNTSKELRYLDFNILTFY